MYNRPNHISIGYYATCNCDAQGLAEIERGDECGTAVTHLVDIALDEL